MVVAKWLERLSRNQEVPSTNPLGTRAFLSNSINGRVSLIRYLKKGASLLLFLFPIITLAELPEAKQTHKYTEWGLKKEMLWIPATRVVLSTLVCLDIATHWTGKMFLHRQSWCLKIDHHICLKASYSSIKFIPGFKCSTVSRQPGKAATTSSSTASTWLTSSGRHTQTCTNFSGTSRQ